MGPSPVLARRPSTGSQTLLQYVPCSSNTAGPSCSTVRSLAVSPSTWTSALTTPRVRDFTHETTVTEHRSTCQCCFPAALFAYQRC